MPSRNDIQSRDVTDVDSAGSDVSVRAALVVACRLISETVRTRHACSRPSVHSLNARVAVDVDGRRACLDLSANSDLSLSETESLIQQLVHYHDEGDVTEVVMTVPSVRAPAVEVLIQGVRSESKAVGINSS
jgi:hypothetical protein